MLLTTKSIKRLNICKLLSVFFLFILLSCGGGPSTVTIKGTIENSKNELVLLRATSQNMIKTIDTTRTSRDGYFEFKISIDNPTFLLLQHEGENEPVVLLAEPKEEIVLNGIKGNLSKNYRVYGSNGSLLVQNINNKLTRTTHIVDSLSYVFRESREKTNFREIKQEIDSIYDSTIKQHKDYTINFIKENRYSLASILALYQQYYRDNHVLNQREDFAYFQMVDASLYPLYPNNELVANLHSNVRKMEKQLEIYDKRQDMLLEGQTLPNMKLTKTNGEKEYLLDIGGRYILVDFWATWCKECLTNNKKLKETYESFSHRGFSIAQISLDDSPEPLQLYIEKNEIPWNIYCDYLQWESPIIDSLSINSIPSNYLIDRNGVVKARNLSDNELREVLTSLLR